MPRTALLVVDDERDTNDILANVLYQARGFSVAQYRCFQARERSSR